MQHWPSFAFDTRDSEKDPISSPIGRAPAEMAKSQPFRFRELPLEMQLRVLHYSLGESAGIHLLLLCKTCYSHYTPYFHQNSTFTFECVQQLGRFFVTAKVSCLQNVRHMRYNYGSEARPSLNSNARKDAKWNAMKVSAFVNNLTECHELSNLRRLDVCFETELLLHKFSCQDHASTIEQILTPDTTTIRTARMSEDILLETFEGWSIHCEFEYCAWWHARAKGHGFDSYDCPHNAKDCKGDRREGDGCDEAVVHQVMLILRRP